MDSTEELDGINVIAQKTLQANKVHQYALKVYTERLEAELRTIDKLLVCILFCIVTICHFNDLNRPRLMLKTKMTSQSLTQEDM